MFNTLIIIDGFDEWAVGFFKGTKWVTPRDYTLVCSIAETGTESEDLGFGLEYFGFAKVEIFVGFEVFLEAVYIIINKKVDSERVVYDIYFY